ncbi:PREDICTED: ankyrin repeat domain-containing protein 29-like [Amphimedon queenslandica]|nr:PREDICTED: ankyrin repeat domain-containing protein 29-like [Amphimedon queenslandica]|eukprot:XP_019848666.1 PREDICTED: ankyrin repeat domain-containing protein 29-like [Amphimedon queenslandica]
MNKEEEKDETSFSQYLMRGVFQEKIDVVRFILSLDGLRLADTISPCIEEAVESGNIQILSMLLESGGDPNFIGNKGLTPLQTASKQGHITIVNKLLQYKADPNQDGIDGATALMLASNFDHFDIVEQLLSSGASVNKTMFDGWTALIFACDQNHLQIVKRLLQSGANPNVLTHSSKCSPVYFASSKHNNPSMLAALIETGADINTTTETGVTPLIVAAQFGFEAIVSVLLNHKALLDCQTHHGFTALMAAAHKGHVDITESLLLAGASTHIADNNGRTALEWSLQSEQHEITQLLLMNVGDVIDESDHAYNAEYQYGGKRISEDISSPKLHPSIIKLREAMRKPPLSEDTGQKHRHAIRWNNEHLVKK